METDPRTPQPQRKGWLLPAALLIAALLVAGIAAYFLTASPAGGSPGGQAAPHSQGDGIREGLGIPDMDRYGRRIEVPDNPEGQPLGQRRADQAPAGAVPAKPDGLMWQRTRYSPLPFSPQDGPSEIGQCRAAGYSHTPPGAAIASMHLGTRAALCDEEDLDRFLADQVVGTDEEIASIRDQNRTLAQTGTSFADAVSNAPAPDAVRIRSYAPDFAVVEWAQRDEGGSSWTVSSIAVAWRDGDWKFVAGRMFERFRVTALTSGWVAWA
jgi:hypothetical protein